MANPNNVNYFIRSGSVLPPFALGSVVSTGNINYFIRAGTVIYPAAIYEPAPVATNGNFLIFLGS